MSDYDFDDDFDEGNYGCYDGVPAGWLGETAEDEHESSESGLDVPTFVRDIRGVDVDALSDPDLAQHLYNIALCAQDVHEEAEPAPTTELFKHSMLLDALLIEALRAQRALTARLHDCTGARRMRIISKVADAKLTVESMTRMRDDLHSVFEYELRNGVLHPRRAFLAQLATGEIHMATPAESARAWATLTGQTPSSVEVALSTCNASNVHVAPLNRVEGHVIAPTAVKPDAAEHNLEDVGNITGPGRVFFPAVNVQVGDGLCGASSGEGTPERTQKKTRRGGRGKKGKGKAPPPSC